MSGLSFLFGLAPGGVYHDRRCCQPRGALLPHRFTLIRIISQERRKQADGIVSVALSLGSPPPAVSRHRLPVEPGLSSMFRKEHSDRPTIWLGVLMPACRGRVKRQAGGVTSKSGSKEMIHVGGTCICHDALARTIYPDMKEKFCRRFITGAAIPMPSQDVNRGCVHATVAVNNHDEAASGERGQLLAGDDGPQMFHKGGIVEPAQLAESKLVIKAVQHPRSDDEEHEQKGRDQNDKPPDDMLL